jgi:hypothetical protein
MRTVIKPVAFISFGFGLSDTTFEYSGLKVPEKKPGDFRVWIGKDADTVPLEERLTISD